MNAQLLYLGDCIVNLAHVVKADFTPPTPGGEERYDEDSGQTYTTRPHKAALKLTLSAVELETHIDDFSSGYHVAAASESQVKVVYGEVAERAWAYLCQQAVGLAHESEVPA